VTSVLIQTISLTSTFFTSTTTTDVTTITVTEPPLVTPTCTSVSGGIPNEFSLTYNIQYVGSQTLNPNNPANDPRRSTHHLHICWNQRQSPPSFPPSQNQKNLILTNFEIPQTVCQAAQSCASYSATTDSPYGEYGYLSFNLQWIDSTSSWFCISYFDIGVGASYYNVDTPGVSQSYGYAWETTTTD
jgi:hypothetical protein